MKITIEIQNGEITVTAESVIGSCTVYGPDQIEYSIEDSYADVKLVCELEYAAQKAFDCFNSNNA